MKSRKVVPLIGPLLTLLRSRKFLIALITLLVDVLVIYHPALEPVQNELIAVFTAIGSVLIASIAYEDRQSVSEQES